MGQEITRMVEQMRVERRDACTPLASKGQVERTEQRPLVSGKISSNEALVFFAVLMGISFLLVLLQAGAGTTSSRLLPLTKTGSESC